MAEIFRALINPQQFAKLSDENLFIVLEDLQNSTTNLFNEAWRRGLQQQLAEKAMQMKHEGPKIL